MRVFLKSFRLGAGVFAVTAVLSVPLTNSVAQTAPVPVSAVLSETLIKALQESLNKQGIVVKIDGILSDETRAGIRKYQSQHHLPVTGEPDKATLDKLGVVASQNSAGPQPSAVAQAPRPQGPMQPGQMQGGMMRNCPMMEGQMQTMMQMMQGMMQMMQTMQGQMQGGQMQPGSR